MDNTLTQWAQMLYVIYGGAVMSLYYDALRPFRANKWMDMICDALFWLGSFWLCVYILTRACALEFRLYFFVGFAIGFVVCHFTIGKFFRAILDYTGKAFVRFSDFLATMLD